MDYYSIVWMHSLLLPPPPRGHLGSFQVSVIMSIDICVPVFMWTWVLNSFGYTYQEAWLWDGVVSVGLILWETDQLSSNVATPFYVPTSNGWELLWLLSTFAMVRSLDVSCSNRCAVVFPCGFNLWSSRDMSCCVSAQRFICCLSLSLCKIYNRVTAGVSGPLKSDTIY